MRRLTAWEEHALCDAIIITAAAGRIPAPLVHYALKASTPEVLPKNADFLLL
jgi:protein-L-isoaspartate O-methyltransferase